MLKDGEIISARYRILCQIGRGGTSRVYRVEDGSLHKKWALKVVRPGESCQKVYGRELELLCRLSHPGLPRIVDRVETRDGPGIVMDLLEGKTLDHLRPSGGFPVEQVLSWGCQICDILEYLHHCDPPVIYGDLKPGNLLLRPDGHIMLLDLGISPKLVTPDYAAPEQLVEGGSLSPQTDLYGLGRTMAVLSGLEGRKKAGDRIRQPRSGRHMAFRHLIGCLTDPEPLKRGPDASWVKTMIQRTLQSEMNQYHAEDSSRKRKIRAASGGSILFALAIVSLTAGASLHHTAESTGSKEAVSKSISTEQEIKEKKNIYPEEKVEKIQKFLEQNPEKRNYKKLSDILDQWSLVLQSRQSGQSDKEIFQCARQEKICAGYFLTYEEELKAAGASPRTEAESLLLDAEKKLDGLSEKKETESGEKREVLSLLLGLYQRSGQTESALEAAREELLLETEATGQAKARLVILNLLIDLDKREEAEKAFRELTGLDPGMSRAYLSMISYDYRTGRLDEAAELYQMAEAKCEIGGDPDFQVMKTKLENAGAM